MSVLSHNKHTDVNAKAVDGLQFEYDHGNT